MHSIILTKRWGLRCIQMCLVDNCTVCYVSVLHYLSGFDSSGTKLSSSTSSTLQIEREQPWKMMVSCNRCGVVAWDKPKFSCFCFQQCLEFRPIAATHIHTHLARCTDLSAGSKIFLPVPKPPSSCPTLCCPSMSSTPVPQSTLWDHSRACQAMGG